MPNSSEMLIPGTSTNVSADVWRNVFCILEFVFIKNHFYTLELFTRAEIDSIISHMYTV